MKTSKGRKWTAGLVAVAGVSTASAISINVDSVGINITNTRGNGTETPGMLVPLVYQGGSYAPGDNSTATRLDWTDIGGTYNPGQVQGYNLIMGTSLAQPGVNVVDDDNASENGTYSFAPGFTYYLTAHYGGSFVAWAFDVTDATADYEAPASIGGVGGANAYAILNPPPPNGNSNNPGNYNPNQGLSNVRAWQGGRIPSIVTPPRNIPDGGTTMSLMGLALGGLAAGRRFLKK